jgi:hypothetical protein
MMPTTTISSSNVNPRAARPSVVAEAVTYFLPCPGSLRYASIAGWPAVKCPGRPTLGRPGLPYPNAAALGVRNAAVYSDSELSTSSTMRRASARLDF